jgi:hypothetical protein
MTTSLRTLAWRAIELGVEQQRFIDLMAYHEWDRQSAYAAYRSARSEALFGPYKYSGIKCSRSHYDDMTHLTEENAT